MNLITANPTTLHLLENASPALLKAIAAMLDEGTPFTPEGNALDRADRRTLLIFRRYMHAI